MTTKDLEPIIRGCFEAVEAVCRDRVELQKAIYEARSQINAFELERERLLNRIRERDNEIVILKMKLPKGTE